MGDGESAAVELAEQRLHVAQDRLAGGRIAIVADRGATRQAVDHLAAREGVADQAHAPLGMEAGAVERHDAGRLLAAMLQRVQPERRDRGRVRMAEDAEHAALLVQAVLLQVDPVQVDPGPCVAEAVRLIHRLAFRAPAGVQWDFASAKASLPGGSPRPDRRGRRLVLLVRPLAALEVLLQIDVLLHRRNYPVAGPFQD